MSRPNQECTLLAANKKEAGCGETRNPLDERRKTTCSYLVCGARSEQPARAFRLSGKEQTTPGLWGDMHDFGQHATKSYPAALVTSTTREATQDLRRSKITHADGGVHVPPARPNRPCWERLSH